METDPEDPWGDYDLAPREYEPMPSYPALAWLCLGLGALIATAALIFVTGWAIGRVWGV